MIPRLPSLAGSRPPRAVVAAALVVALAGCTDSTPATAPAASPETNRSTTTAAAEPPPSTLISGRVPFPMDATIAELQRAMGHGRISSVELVDFFLARIEAKGVEVLKRDDSDPSGKFAWILDPEGNKLELWQPPAE